MKPVFLYRLRLPLFVKKAVVAFLKAARIPVFYWGENAAPKGYAQALTFPPAGMSTVFETQSRQHVAQYFKTNAGKMSGGDRYRFDYVRKWVDIGFLDYFAFRSTIEKSHSKSFKSKIFGRAFLAAIYENRIPKLNWRCLILYFTGPMVLLMRTAYGLQAILRTRSKIEVPRILFLRKKVYPDLGTFSELKLLLNAQQSATFDGSYMAFNLQGEKYQISFINRYKGSGLAVIRAMLKSLNSLVGDVWYFFSRGVDYECASRFIVENYLASIVAGLGPRFICGVLVDKPANILLSRHKNTDQKILALNESFFFPPGRSFDYNHLDVYYSLNDIDESMQNLYGGEIKEFKRVEFFRKTKAPSKGVSEDLKEKISQFKYRVVTAPAQIFVERTGYYYWAYAELESFILANIALAKAFPDVLVIIKGKKGELATLPPHINRELDALTNLYVVHSIRPRDLEFNHLEDILPECDLLISMCHTSTTIWQALAGNKPFIAINDVHPSTFLAEYEGFECDLANLNATVQAWRILPEKELRERLQRLAARVNLGLSKGIQQIAEDMMRRLNQ